MTGSQTGQKSGLTWTSKQLCKLWVCWYLKVQYVVCIIPRNSIIPFNICGCIRQLLLIL